MSALLSMNVTIDYPRRGRVLERCELQVGSGEIVGLVGPSGSGKSSLALAVLGLLRYRGGRVGGYVRMNGVDLLTLRESQLRRMRGRDIGLVLQSPASALNPCLTLGAHFREAWKAHRKGCTENLTEQILTTLADVSLPADPDFLRLYPRQLSVGQAQRVLIALGVLHRPALLVADEPASALDPISNAEVHQLLQRLNRRYSMAVLYISHDLLAVSSFCQRVAILYEGRIVENSPAGELFATPAHPYTRRLVSTLDGMCRQGAAIFAGRQRADVREPEVTLC